MTVSRNTPVSGSERIVALDVLRGFAVLGILLINIQAFSMVGATYLNPSANSMLQGAGYWVWAASFLLGDQKFMTIFSILFGAGIILISRRAEAKGVKAGWLHLRRQSTLLLFGMAHAYLIWSGDILVAYAICGLVAYLFRNRSPRTLIVVGMLVFAVSSGLSVMAQLSMPTWPAEAMAEQVADWAPGQEEIDAEIAAFRGGWAQQMTQRVPDTLMMQTIVFFFWAGWRAGGLMLVGMALFKLGVLSAERSAAFYRRWVMAGLPVGYAIVAWGIWRNTEAGFAFERSMFIGAQPNYWGSLLVSMGYISLVMLAIRNGWMAGLQRRLAATGRMAFTNYLTQSLIATFIFYGHGLGMFERVPRPGQLLVVAAIWGVQLLWSPWWLERFRFGPFEWLWRSMVYMKPQPMRN
jgi:uncharacterized protein